MASSRNNNLTKQHIDYEHASAPKAVHVVGGAQEMSLHTFKADSSRSTSSATPPDTFIGAYEPLGVLSAEAANPRVPIYDGDILIFWWVGGRALCVNRHALGVVYKWSWRNCASMGESPRCLFTVYDPETLISRVSIRYPTTKSFA